MPAPIHTLVSYLRIAAGAWKNDPRDDIELLTRFATTRDETAFASLVGRHGAMVWRTCKHILGNATDAEDAFQTVFLALARKAGLTSVKNPAGWLHMVARRTALNARTAARRRPDLKHQSLDEITAKSEEVNPIEQYTILDEELAGLPEKLRVPLILRYLEEKSQDEVARILGCSRRAAQKRLEKGEAILRERMEKRGLSADIGAIAALIGRNNGIPIVSGRLIESTTRAAMSFRAGTLTGVTADAAQKMLRALAVQGATRASWWLVLACIGVFGIGGVVRVAWKLCGDASNAVTSAESKPASSNVTVDLLAKRLDCYGDPLPDQAIARIGTNRYRSGLRDSRNINSDDCSAVFFPDGKTLASVHGGDFVCIWETATGKELRRLAAPAGCGQVAISPDGRKIALVGNMATWGWDLSLNPPCKWLCQSFNGSNRDVAVTFSPDNKVLAVVVKIVDGTNINLFDIATGKIEKNFTITQTILRWPTNNRNYATFAPDGKKLALGNSLWNITTGTKQVELKELLNKQGAPKEVKSWAFSPDGNLLAATHVESDDTDTVWYALRIWDVATGNVCCRRVNDGLYHSGYIAFLPDSKTLLEVDSGIKGSLKIRFWDSGTGKEKLQTPVTCENSFLLKNLNSHVSKDGLYLACPNKSMVGVWEVATGRETGPAGALLGGYLALSPDGQTIVTRRGWGGNASEFRVWETESGRFVKKLEMFTKGSPSYHPGWGIEPLLDYSDGRRIIAKIGYPDGCEFVDLDIQTGEISRKKLPVPPSSVPAANEYAVSTDGRWQLWGVRGG